MWTLVLSLEVRCVLKGDKMYLSSAGSRFCGSGTNLGLWLISGSRSTLRLGVKGSGRRMLRGKADRMRLRIWMQLGGMTLHSWK